MNIPPGCDVYSVGALSELKRIKVALNPFAFRPRHTSFSQTTVPVDWRKKQLSSAFYSIKQSWRHKSFWNGYLAEPTIDDIFWTRCGHGWTKRRALKSLKRHIGEVQW